jgi:hypothetical protein
MDTAVLLAAALYIHGGAAVKHCEYRVEEGTDYSGNAMDACNLEKVMFALRDTCTSNTQCKGFTTTTENGVTSGSCTKFAAAVPSTVSTTHFYRKYCSTDDAPLSGKCAVLAVLLALSVLIGRKKKTSQILACCFEPNGKNCMCTFNSCTIALLGADNFRIHSHSGLFKMNPCTSFDHCVHRLVVRERSR